LNHGRASINYIGGKETCTNHWHASCQLPIWDISVILFSNIELPSSDRVHNYASGRKNYELLFLIPHHLKLNELNSSLNLKVNYSSAKIFGD
jgi:hypothetical protein